MQLNKAILKIDTFVVATIAVILIAYLFPQLRTEQIHAAMEWISKIGIVLIFFFYGLKLSFYKLKNGLMNWKLHVLIQISTFVLFPLIVLPFQFLIHSEQTQIIWLSFLFLAALPSTVSTSVVMVSIAKGNIPAAIFNASISGLIGVLVTPLWIGLFSEYSTTGLDLSSIYFNLLVEILLPVFLGILLQPYFGKYAHRFSKPLTVFDKSIVLLIIFKSFSEAFEANYFTVVSLNNLVFIFIAVIILFYIMYFLTGVIAQKLHFSREDCITAQYCGTKKSLIHGTVFSKILFSSTMPIGILLLPLMIFHALQILIVSVIDTKKGNEA